MHVASPALGGRHPAERPTVTDLAAFFVAQKAALAAIAQEPDGDSMDVFESYETQSEPDGSLHCAAGSAACDAGDYQKPEPEESSSMDVFESYETQPESQ